MKSTRILLSITIIPQFILLSACRLGLRSGSDSGDTVSVDIRTVGIKESDRNRNDLVYTLSTCGSGAANGTPTKSDLVTFQARGVRRDDRCDVKVSGGDSQSKNIEWMSTPGLLYQAKQVLIVSAEGKLKSVAPMQQLYTLQTSSGAPNASIFKISTKVTATKSLEDICTCTLACAPSIPNNAAKLEPSSDKMKGECTFTNNTKADLKRSECSHMVVQCGGDLYKGTWSPAQVVDGSVAGNLAFPEVKLEAGTIDDLVNASIEVQIPN